MEDVKEKIVRFIKEAAKRPVTLRETARAIGAEGRDMKGIKRLLRELESEGVIVKIRGDRFGLAGKMNLMVGELIGHPDGFGFVRPESGEGSDLFINPRRLSGAMHGDKVAARIESDKGKGRREGSIVRVIKRAHKTIVGRYEVLGGFGVVVPTDERLTDRIIIPASESGGAQGGVVVEAEITRWPSKNSGPAGRIIEVMGDPADPDVEAGVILKKFGLPLAFPSAVMREARSTPKGVSEDETKGRVDLRAKTTVTIDGETAKDFDDAVGIERTSSGYRLFVSIADVSHYVKEGSLMDAEAYSRGTSVYFPDRCIPMLPEALSNGICSLNPRVERLTMTAEMEFDNAGERIKKRFYESVIKSAERMTYTKVKRILTDDDAGLKAEYGHITGDLKLMEELAAKLAERRREAGSIDFDLPEPQIIIDIEGKVEDIARSERNVAHRLIEEFMLAANRAVAEVFSSERLPFLYRVHEAPDEESIEDFREFVSGLGLRLKDHGMGPKAFQRSLEEVKGTKLERLVNHVLLRSMKQAVYSAENVGHFGLAFEDYAHFTSPIRRYPDLIVHRLLKLVLTKRYSARLREEMQAYLGEAGRHASERERKAMEAERECVDLKKCQFMKDKEGMTFDGFISGVTSFGLFVELKDYLVEALVHVSSLKDDYYIFDEKRHSLSGEHTKRTFRLADAIRVRIGRVDLERRRIDASLDEPEAASNRKAKAAKYKGRGRKG